MPGVGRGCGAWRRPGLGWVSGKRHGKPNDEALGPAPPAGTVARGGSGGRGEGAHGEPWGRGRSTLHTRRPRRPALLVAAEIHVPFTASSLSPAPPDRVVAEIETKVCLLLADGHRDYITPSRFKGDPGTLVDSESFQDELLKEERRQSVFKMIPVPSSW